MDMLPVEMVTKPDVIRMGTDEVIVLATCAQTNDDLFAVEIRMQPGGGPPVMHRHQPSEVYYVLRGEFTFYVGDEIGTVRRFTAAAGATVPLAGGTPHSVRNESHSDAAAFVVHAPGPVMENFSRATAALMANGSPSMADVLDVAQRNGVDILGPIPSLV